MNIISCFLDSANKKDALTQTIGERIHALGKSCLWSRRSAVAIDTVVIHYISAGGYFPLDPYNENAVFAIFPEYAVSSHYLISRDGNIYHLVPEKNKAWHSGGSIMPDPDNRRNVNEFSIGIELIATHTSGFTDVQYESLSYLCNDIETRWPISSYVGHSDIAGKEAVALGLRTDLKIDPGPLFDWQKFHTMRSRI
jgi:N-acetyl-anhydromuramyl-L-alanine amidase AmpD